MALDKINMFTLHAHSNYSLLEGTIPVEELVSFAKRSGSQFVALTDTNAMYGLIQFVKLAREQNIKPVLGALIDDPKNKGFKVIFIAKNNVAGLKLQHLRFGCNICEHIRARIGKKIKF